MAKQAVASSPAPHRAGRGISVSTHVSGFSGTYPRPIAGAASSAWAVRVAIGSSDLYAAA